MRELKFRIWDKSRNCFSTQKIIKLDGADSNFGDYHIDLDGNVRYMNYDSADLDEDAVVQQYTGTKDKNGIDIYEGDIVDVMYWNEDAFDNKIRLTMNGVVEYNEKYSTYYVVCKCDGGSIGHCSLYSKPDAPRLKIVGNIFENPELLK